MVDLGKKHHKNYAYSGIKILNFLDFLKECLSSLNYF